ncbi:MAG: hypothetical protein RL514_3469 [Verrucomicrobiota bacterium]|jgi:hypothetical protein
MKPATEPFPGHALHVAALDHALRLARSAYLELGVALAVQSANLPGTRTTAHVHALMALPRAQLVRHFLRVVRTRAANVAEQHRAWQVLIRKVATEDARSPAWPEPPQSALGYVTPHQVSCWTSFTGQLAKEILTCQADSPEYWQLFADTAKDLKDCYFLHLA